MENSDVKIMLKNANKIDSFILLVVLVLIYLINDINIINLN